MDEVQELDFGLWMPGSGRHRPERRWLRANDLIARDQQPGQLDDEWTGYVFKALVERHPSRRSMAILQAQRIREAEDQCFRWQLEGRLLAGQTNEVIAAVMQMPVVVVEAFHETFYCVRPWLKATDWIMFQVIGGLPFLNFAGAEQPATLIRYMAYRAGVLAMEVAITVLLNKPVPPGVIRAHGAEGRQEEAIFRLRMKAFFRFMTAQTDAEAETALATYHAMSPSRSSLSRSDAMRPILAKFLGEVASPSPPSDLEDSTLHADSGSKTTSPKRSHRPAKENSDVPQDRASSGSDEGPTFSTKPASRRKVRRKPTEHEPSTGGGPDNSYIA